MKKIYFLGFLFLIVAADLQAQAKKYRVLFTDKNNTPYTITNPSAFLTARSIQRRVNQSIPVQQNDLPVDPAYVQQVVAAGASVLHTSRWFNCATVIIPDSTVLAAVQALPFVQSVNKVNRIVKNLPEEYKNPSPAVSADKKNSLILAPSILPSSYSYGQALAQVQQLGGDCMHNQGYDGKNMLICVLDAGFSNVNTLSCFDSLWANNQILGTWDVVENETTVFEDHTHGAMVLSCMGSNLPGQIVGTAPKANYWLLRTEDVGSELVIEEDNWAYGAEFADSVGADVINSSLGYTTFDISSQSHTWADLDGNTAIATIAADLAASKGILVCNSAGNEGASGWKYIGIPADADSICTVGAVDANGIRAGFSSQGPTADGRIKPDLAAMGNGTSVIDPGSGNVVQQGGTSFSSPLMAGMVACLWQANPGKTNMELLTAMRSAGNQSANPDTLLGWGIPNFCTANIVLGGIAGPSDKSSDQLTNVFYDPATGTFNFYFFSKAKEDIVISVYDLSGKLQLQEQRAVGTGSYTFFQVQNAKDISTGIYLLSVKTSEKKFVKKMLKY
jgi:serine protease AprX